MNATIDEDRARRRFFLLALLRLGGAAMMMSGFVVISGKLVIFGTMFDKILGVGAVLGGVLCFTYLPLRLARRWKTQSTTQGGGIPSEQKKLDKESPQS